MGRPPKPSDPPIPPPDAPPDAPIPSQSSNHVEPSTPPPAKRKRPDVAERLLARKGTATYTIKTGWLGLRAHPAVEVGVQHILPVIHQATIEGALLAQTVVLNCISTATPVPPLDQTFFYRCFTQVTRNNDRETVPPPSRVDQCIAAGFEMYKCARAPSLPWPVKKHCTAALNWAAKDYLTACKNHVALNFKGRIHKYWQRCLWGCVPASRKALNAMKRWLTDIVMSGETVSVEEWTKHVSDTFPNCPHDTLAAESAFWQLQDVMGKAATVYSQQQKGGKSLYPLTPITIASRWECLLPVLYWMRAQCDESQREYMASKSPEILEETKGSISPMGRGHTKGCFRTFSLLPVPSHQAKYMHMDNTVLYDAWALGAAVAREGGKYPSRSDILANKPYWWRAAFPGLQHVRSPSNATGDRWFDHLLSTDGMGVSLTWRRPAKRVDTYTPLDGQGLRGRERDSTAVLSNTVTRKRKRAREHVPSLSIRGTAKYCPPNSHNPTSNDPVFPDPGGCPQGVTPVGADPGRNELVVAVRHGESTPYVKVTSRAWYGPAYTNSHKRAKRMSTKYTAKVHTVSTDAIPSLKTVDAVAWAAGVAYHTDALTRSLVHYGNKGARRLRWGGYIAHQKAMARLVGELADNPGITEVAFGDWGNGPGLATGHGCGPVKSLVKALRVHPRVRLHVVDEFCSSKLCCRCDQELFAPVDRQTCEKIWGMRVCKHCGITWNRNTNAAHNILHAHLDPVRPSRLRSERACQRAEVMALPRPAPPPDQPSGHMSEDELKLEGIETPAYTSAP